MVMEQLWVLVVAAGEGHASATPTSLRDGVNLAMAVAPRHRVYAVVTQEQRARMEGPLWLLPASNVVAPAQPGGDAHGILAALRRIAARDPGARVVLLPSTHHVQDEEAFADSLRNGAADTAYWPEKVVRVGAKPDAADSGVVVGAARALLQMFERRMPETVAAMREVVRRDPRGREGAIAPADPSDRQPYLDFNRHVFNQKGAS